jgi:hypothetical protein
MKDKWVFFEYNDQEKDCPNRPFSSKVFRNFDKMKIYSGKMYAEHKSICVDYCSNYIRVSDDHIVYP